MEALCSVMMQQKMVSCKKKAMALLKGKALLKTRNYRVKASVRIGRVWKTLTAVLDRDASSNKSKGYFLPRARARHAVTIKATRLRSAAYTQLVENGVVHLEVELGQLTAKTNFLIVPNLATNMILGTAYLSENAKKIIPKDGALKATGSSPVAI